MFKFFQPPQVNGSSGAMFDSYNFGQTVSPEVGQTATTPGESPKVEESFATFGDQSPFGGPASPQPKVNLVPILRTPLFLLRKLTFFSFKTVLLWTLIC